MVHGYTSSTYGDRFVDVYDDWYGEVTDTAGCVAAVAELANGGAVLELGVGTGRLAIPLARRGITTVGLDSSRAMLEALAAKPDGSSVTVVEGDMADPEAALVRSGWDPTGPEGSFTVVLVAFNTLFNLVDVEDQRRCLAAAARLAPRGTVVIEAFVPDPDSPPTDAITPRRVTVDQVVLSVSRSDPARQEVQGQYIELTEGGNRLRPWHIRWSTPTQLDEMAASAGLTRVDRWADWDRTPFHDEAETHISLYRPT